MMARRGPASGNAAGAGAEVPYAISLRLIDQKPPALHHGGFIDYGPSGGSYYYSRTRIEVHGQLTRGDGAPEPPGQAWMDHQWGNFVVVGGGWDWFSLQFEDRTELMLYVLRTAQGEITAVYGTQVLADGTTRELEPGTASHGAGRDVDEPAHGRGVPVRLAAQPAEG